MALECLPSMTAESCAAIGVLRKGGHVEWYVVDVLAFVIYVYVRTWRRGDRSIFVLSLGFWAVEFLWEMFNALILKATGESALWTIEGKSSYLIYAGLNLEIAFMFAIAPIVVLGILPADRSRRLLGVSNRVLLPAGVGVLCVAVECLLNRAGLLAWHWWFWRFPMVPLILAAYCGPFVALVWIFDHVRFERQVQGAVAAVVLAAAAHLALASGLGWV